MVIQIYGWEEIWRERYIFVLFISRAFIQWYHPIQCHWYHWSVPRLFWGSCYIDWRKIKDEGLLLIGWYPPKGDPVYIAGWCFTSQKDGLLTCSAGDFITTCVFIRLKFKITNWEIQTKNDCSTQTGIPKWKPIDNEESARCNALKCLEKSNICLNETNAVLGQSISPPLKWITIIFTMLCNRYIYLYPYTKAAYQCVHICLASLCITFKTRAHTSLQNCHYTLPYYYNSKISLIFTRSQWWICCYNSDSYIDLHLSIWFCGKKLLLKNNQKA